jgi:hypothetical protein
VHTQALRVAIAPGGPFNERWFNLTVPAEYPTVATDE